MRLPLPDAADQKSIDDESLNQMADLFMEKDLLNPSAETAMEWLNSPAAIFAMHKNRFNRMPITLDKVA